MRKTDKEVKAWRAHPLNGLELVKARMGPHGLGRHFHDCWSLGTILQGACSFQVSGRDHRVVCGEIFVIPPFEVHECAAGSDNVAYAVLYVEQSIVNKIAPALVAELAAKPKRVWQQGAIAMDMACSVHGEIEIRSVADWLLELQEAVITDAFGGKAQSRLHPLQEILEQCWNQDIALSELEMSTGFSRFHTVRTFTRDVGIAPGAYLRQLRVLKARRFLRSGQSLSSVAQDLYFSDQAHFTRAFKEVHGIPPGCFRRLAIVNGDKPRPKNS